MFNGIIESTGTIQKIDAHGESNRLTIEFDAKKFDDIKLGDSIAVNGICLTLEDTTVNQLIFYTSGETNLKISPFHVGQKVNLERSLILGSRISGHFVFGHVDNTGILKELKMVGKSWFMKIEFPKYLKKYIIPKGSISLNGISLTVNEVSSKNFNCMIIPHTYKYTDIKTYKLNQILNLEVDMLARYAHFSNKTK